MVKMVAREERSPIERQLAVCRRCGHDVDEHHESGVCASMTRKGHRCQCPGFLSGNVKEDIRLQKLIERSPGKYYGRGRPGLE